MKILFSEFILIIITSRICFGVRRNITMTRSSNVNTEEVCYSVLGCFSMASPWISFYRPMPSPESPSQISTRIYYYSRLHRSSKRFVRLYPNISLDNTDFDCRKISVLLTHGFLGDGNEIWIKNLKNAYLTAVDANIFIVDWGKGAIHFDYWQVASNIRVVSRELERFVKFLILHEQAEALRFHLIGHSLGAHVMSYLAKNIYHIGRLTALDPAQPGFEGLDKIVRLDKSDAEFVDVLHTDGVPFIPSFGLGMVRPYGHVDFYINEGFDQPGCLTLKISLESFKNLIKHPRQSIINFLSCSHTRSYLYFTEALLSNSKCTFWGRKTSSNLVVLKLVNSLTFGQIMKLVANTDNCTIDDCVPLGLWSHLSPVRGSVIVTTNSKSPYCVKTTVFERRNYLVSRGSFKRKKMIQNSHIPQRNALHFYDLRNGI